MIRIANNWNEYRLIDATCGERLEKWGNLTVIRPDPQIIWRSDRKTDLWLKSDIHYHRSTEGGGSWTGSKKQLILPYKNLKFIVKPTDFKHMGLFPEQATNWDYVSENVTSDMKVLNLFGYTGAMSIACAKMGANTTHVDASKGIVNWAKDNANLNNVNIRWIVEDCTKFVQREIRRGNTYDALIMDPPSYGHGSNGEIWKFEDNIYDFLKICKNIISKNFKFIMLSTYTTAISPTVISYIMEDIFKIKALASEIAIPIETGGLLPCGSTVICKT